MASHFLALHHALRKSRPAPALFGTGLGTISLAVMAASALLHVASVPLPNLYHAPGTTAEAQATLDLIWQATWGVFEALSAPGCSQSPSGWSGSGWRCCALRR